MIRNIGEKILKNKKVLSFIEKISALLIVVGICFAFYVPRDIERSKIEENALSPSLNKMNSLHSLMADKYFGEISESLKTFTEVGTPIQFLEKFFNENNLEYAYQNFTQKTEKGVEKRQNIVGIYRAQKSNNFECNLIAFDINPIETKISIPFALSFVKYYENHKINYVSRDVIFLGYDSRGKNYGYSIEKFLNEYLSESAKIPKCGVIRQALNIDLESNFSQLYLKSLGFDGKVPDRDYFLGFNNLFFDTFGERGYKYTEASPKIPVYFGNFLEKTWNHLKIVIPSNFFHNFKYFFHIMIGGLYGDKHDAHPQMIFNGIQALTIKGKQDKKEKLADTNFATKLGQLFNIVDTGIRANFSLDEQLHAGSTLYYPVIKQYQITIKKLPLPLILVALPFAIKQLGFYFKANKQELNALMTYSRNFQIVFHSFLCLVLPNLAQILFSLLHPNEGNPVFCQSWSSLSNPQLLKLFYVLVGLMVATRLLIKFVIDYLILKGILRQNTKITTKDHDMITGYNGIIYAFTLIVYMFINTSIAYFLMVIFAPFFYFQRPLLPRSVGDFVRSVLTLGLLYLIYFILIQFDLNYLEETIEVVISQQCIPSFTGWFALSTLFNLFWSSLEIFLM